MQYSDRAACDFISQRLSCVTQVDGDEAQLVYLRVVFFVRGCVCERGCVWQCSDSVRPDKGSIGKRAEMIHY